MRSEETLVRQWGEQAEEEKKPNMGVITANLGERSFSSICRARELGFICPITFSYWLTAPSNVKSTTLPA